MTSCLNMTSCIWSCLNWVTINTLRNTAAEAQSASQSSQGSILLKITQRSITRSWQISCLPRCYDRSDGMQECQARAFCLFLVYTYCRMPGRRGLQRKPPPTKLWANAEWKPLAFQYGRLTTSLKISLNFRHVLEILEKVLKAKFLA